MKTSIVAIVLLMIIGFGARMGLNSIRSTEEFSALGKPTKESIHTKGDTPDRVSLAQSETPISIADQPSETKVIEFSEPSFEHVFLTRMFPEIAAVTRNFLKVPSGDFPATGIGYLVKKDDNLRKIAIRFKSKVSWIQIANKINDPSKDLQIDQKIFVPQLNKDNANTEQGGEQSY